MRSARNRLNCEGTKEKTVPIEQVNQYTLRLESSLWQYGKKNTRKDAFIKRKDTGLPGSVHATHDGVLTEETGQPRRNRDGGLLRKWRTEPFVRSLLIVAFRSTSKAWPPDRW